MRHSSYTQTTYRRLLAHCTKNLKCGIPDTINVVSLDEQIFGRVCQISDNSFESRQFKVLPKARFDPFNFSPIEVDDRIFGN